MSQGLRRRWLRRSLLGALAQPDAAAFGEGTPLPPETRSHMETLLGRDLSGVRTFTGERVQGVATALAAEAFTVGASVYLPHPGDLENLPLLAHELTHVVQQQRPSLIPAGAPPSPAPAARESHAAPQGMTASAVGGGAQEGIVPHLSVTLLEASTLEQPPQHPQLSPEGESEASEGAEAQARANEAAVAQPDARRAAGPIDAAAVADRVYRLMRDELLIERERQSAAYR